MRMAWDEPHLAPAHHRHRRGPPHLHRGARAERLVSDMLGTRWDEQRWRIKPEIKNALAERRKIERAG